jgi:hypothetical protein
VLLLQLWGTSFNVYTAFPIVFNDVTDEMYYVLTTEVTYDDLYEGNFRHECNLANAWCLLAVV